MPTRTTAASCLLVDDHPAICQGVRQLLESEQLLSVVADATSGEHALELLRQLRPDVALVDLRLLTAMSGLQVTEAARDEGLPTRIVIYSGQGSVHDARRSFDCGAFGFVDKRSSYDVVLASLHAVAGGDGYLDPSVAAQLDGNGGDSLSRRELDVLELVARGMQNATIAFDLGVSSETVKAHVANILRKLGVHTRAGAVASGFRVGLLR